jgi:hypothetical protein
MKKQGPVKYSKEESTEVELGEIRKETVVDFASRSSSPRLVIEHPVRRIRTRERHHQTGGWGQQTGSSSMDRGRLTYRPVINDLDPQRERYLPIGQPSKTSRDVEKNNNVPNKPLNKTKRPSTGEHRVERIIYSRQKTFYETQTGPWEHTNRDTVLKQGYEASGLPPRTCYPRCRNRKPSIISGVCDIDAPDNTLSQEQAKTTQELGLLLSPMLEHNKDEVRDWTFLKKVLTENRITDPALLSQGLKAPSGTPKCKR